MRRVPFVVLLAAVIPAFCAPPVSAGQNPDPLTLQVRPTIFFIEEGGVLRQKCELIVDHPGPETSAELRIKGFPKELRYVLSNLGPGANTISIFLPDHAKTIRATFTVTAGAATAAKTVSLAPQRKWTVHLMPNSHTDIGYTELQPRVAKRQAEYLDRVVEFCRATDGYPEEARFRWNIEIAWALENYLKNRPADQVEALLERLRSGRVELSGWYVQLSDAFGCEELVRAVLPSREYSRTFGFPLRSAMNNDVTGFSWASPQILSQVGVRYFAAGINETRSRAPLRKPNPFFWESPDGSRILVWNGEHYMFSNIRLKLHLGLAESEVPVEEYLAGLQAREDYPYDLVGFPISGEVTDNAGPRKELSDRVVEWNAKWAYPKVRLSTMTEFFQSLETGFAKTIPVHRKAWPDYWTDGVGSTAYETGLNRQAHGDLLTAEKLAVAVSLVEPGAVVPKDEIREGYRQTMLFDEHTWGAHNSISEPDSELARGQWVHKAAFAYNAREIARTVRDRSLSVLIGNIAAGDGYSLVVFNPLSWNRTEIVRTTLPRGLAELKGKFQLKNKKSGAEISYQIAEPQTLIFQADDVPSIGYAVFEVVPGVLPSPPAPVTVVDGNRIENRWYKITADEETGGLRSVIEKESGRELVDPDSPYRLNQFIYENPDGGRAAVDDMGKRASFKRYSPSSAKAAPGLRGPAASSLILSSKAFRHPEIRQEIILYDGLKRIDIINRMWKEETREPEAGYFAFPFAVEGGRFRFDIAGAAMAPETDQLPGTTRDWMAVQDWVEAAGPNGSVTWTPIEAPLVQFGDINTGKWLTKLDIRNQTVFSYAFNNLWMTNFKAGQGGPLEFRYSFAGRPGGADPVASARFGAEAGTPLVTGWLMRRKKGPLPETGMSFFSVDKPNVVIQALTLPETGGEGLAFRLREIGGLETQARIASDLFTAETLTYTVTDIGEHPANAFEVVPGSVYVRLKPYQIVTVIVRNFR
ncbi:MAG: hypothetical protein JW843_11035 [Candidatus Aminicenantes bacterium]|nr:hypothetical protein [Candidatus Aminicenantes bacterium]